MRRIRRRRADPELREDRAQPRDARRQREAAALVELLREAIERGRVVVGEVERQIPRIKMQGVCSWGGGEDTRVYCTGNMGVVSAACDDAML